MCVMQTEERSCKISEGSVKPAPPPSSLSLLHYLQRNANKPTDVATGENAIRASWRLLIQKGMKLKAASELATHRVSRRGLRGTV